MAELSFCVETWEEVWGELGPLLLQHWLEVARDRDKVPLDTDWEAYANLAKLGQLHILGIRHLGQLVGYAAAFVRPHLHYKSTLHGFTDVYWLMPIYRTWTNGVKLFAEFERSLTARGVVK